MTTSHNTTKDLQQNDLKTNYRQSIGLFATGVTVLLVENEGEVYGMTANAVSSVSLEPIQLLVCPSKKSIFAKHLKEKALFSVNILASHQEQISNHFASPDNNMQSSEPLYDFLFSKQITVARLNDCITSFACKITQMHDGGDHWIVVAKVHEIYNNELQIQPQPLLFYAGKYHNPCQHPKEHIKPSADPYK